MFLGRSRFPAGTFTTAARRRKIGVSCDVDSAGLLRESVMLCSASSCSGVNLQRTSRERGCLNSVTYNCPNSNFAILTVRKASNQGVGGSNPSGRTFPIKIFRQPRPAGMEQAVRTADRQQDGSTTRRRAGLDVAAQGAAAVRSEAEDERRSREQSLRAHFLSKSSSAARATRSKTSRSNP